MGAAALALIVANSRFSEAYFGALHAYLGPLSVLHWINDALMALFFLLVGLEIKREFVDGYLVELGRSPPADHRRRSGHGGAGAGVPRGGGPSSPLARGWAIPAATDIAFAIGVLALLGSRAPASLKLFLTTVAIVDDMGAVAIIALAYTAQIDVAALLAAAAVILPLMIAGHARHFAVRRTKVMIAAGHENPSRVNRGRSLTLARASADHPACRGDHVPRPPLDRPPRACRAGMMPPGRPPPGVPLRRQGRDHPSTRTRRRAVPPRPATRRGTFRPAPRRVSPTASWHARMPSVPRRPDPPHFVLHGDEVDVNLAEALAHRGGSPYGPRHQPVTRVTPSGGDPGASGDAARERPPGHAPAPAARLRPDQPGRAQ